MRQANGRVGSYRTVSEDYGPGKITKHKERIKLSRKRVQKMLLLTCENKRYFNYQKNINLFFIGSTFCTLRRTCMHNVFLAQEVMLALSLVIPFICKLLRSPYTFMPCARICKTWICYECVWTCITINLARPCTGHSRKYWRRKFFSKSTEFWVKFYASIHWYGVYGLKNVVFVHFGLRSGPEDS